MDAFRPKLLVLLLAVLIAGCGGGQPQVAPEDVPSDAATLVVGSSGFRDEEIFLPATGDVSIFFRNDGNRPHSVSIYPIRESGDEPILDKPYFEGEIVDNEDQIVYTFQAPGEPDQYFFHCNVHPAEETGTVHFQGDLE